MSGVVLKKALFDHVDSVSAWKLKGAGIGWKRETLTLAVRKKIHLPVVGREKEPLSSVRTLGGDLDNWIRFGADLRGAR
jgi:hypothetical protein